MRDSVYSDLKWAIHKLGLDGYFDCTVSPMQITRRSTGQKILFRGLDDGLKITSISVDYTNVVCEEFDIDKVRAIPGVKSAFNLDFGFTDPNAFVCEMVDNAAMKIYVFDELNQELTNYHQEVLNNLNSTKGGLLRMNRSIQAEGAFGTIKWNRDYKRARRKGLKGVIFELSLISCGFNLHKYHLKKQAVLLAA